tara:strand:- start:1060 stop:1302 length:243 start_codon:yes stop_codon:yes gene_type:complete
MGFFSSFFQSKLQPSPPKPKPTQTQTQTLSPIDIPTGISTGGYGGQTIMTGATGVEQEANVAQTLLGGSRKGKAKTGAYA